MSEGFSWKGFKQSTGFVTFTEFGDKVTGEILSIGVGKDFAGNPVPELVIDTEDGPRTLTAGQAMLKSALAEKEPQVGDYLRVEYVKDGEKKPGKNPPKVFDVQVERIGKDAPTTAADLA